MDQHLIEKMENLRNRTIEDRISGMENALLTIIYSQLVMSGTPGDVAWAMAVQVFEAR